MSSAALMARVTFSRARSAVEPARPNQRFVPRMDRWNTSWDLGVAVSWPLFDGGKAKADRAANLAQAQALTHRLEDFDAGVASSRVAPRSPPTPKP